ncbi:MAG: hypothetical protein ABJ242_07040 [Marinomonas sp.]
MSELERLIHARQLPADAVVVEADAAERAALAKRFSLASVDSLHAKISLEPDKSFVRASGTLKAKVMQICAVSAEEFSADIDEVLDFRFVAIGDVAALDHAAEGADIEVELSGDDCDEIEFSGDTFDLGEAVAQSLGLAIDPYAEGPNADAARKAAGIAAEGEQDGPLAELLAGLKRE